MLRTRSSLVALVAVVASMVGPLVVVPAATADSGPRQHTPSSIATSGPTAPTNLRVRDVRPTQVTFEWDPSSGATTGCSFPFILYLVYVDGRHVGWTVWGSPVALAAQLRPGTTYTLQAQAQDNCSGRLSPLSEPLVVTTPRR
jgi:hypothetical protein